MNSKYQLFTESHYSNCLKHVQTYATILRDKVIFDVGSNIGLFSKAIVETVPYKHLHLFEPCFEYCQASEELLKDYSHITYNPIALGDTIKNGILYKDIKNIGWNTLYTNDPIQGNKQYLSDMNTEDVHITTLDDYCKNIDQVDFIKIDVEGYEGIVLDGAWDTISKFKPHLLIEVSWGHFHLDWEKNIKKYHRIFELGYNPTEINYNNTADILFEPSTYVEFNKKLPISVGILSWNSDESLVNTLNSYVKNGLLEMVNDVTIFFQEFSQRDKEIAEQFSLSYIQSDSNIGIGKAFLALSKNAKSDYIMLLEHDWELIIDKYKTYDRLLSGIKLIQEDYSCIRYRHKMIPGEPLYSKAVYQGKELEFYDSTTQLISPHLLDAIHWIHNPEIEYSDKIQKEGEYYLTTSRWGNWTNNPCLYKKDFYINTISEFIGGGIELEENISKWWAGQNFKVAHGEGLFTHNDIKKYKKTDMPLSNTTSNSSKTNIIDCFPYFNEKEILELRINLLNDYVDYFIIMEGDRTHSGAPKEFTCMKDLETLDINTDKVVVLQVELPEGEDIHNQIDIKNIIKNELERGVEGNKKYLSHWARERIQRDALLNLVDDCDDNTVFFITDCDEIIDPKNIEYIARVVRDNPEAIIKIPLVFLEGSANCRVYYKNGNPVEWNISTFACLKSHLKKATPTELRCNISDYELRFITENGNYVSDLGWHFGWMGDIERRRTKSQSFLHANTFKDEDIVNNIISYIPQEGSPSVSDYRNFILKKYPNSLLPQKIFELPRVKAFLIPDDTPVLNDTPSFTFHNNSRPALWVVDNFYDDPYAVRDFALKQEYLQGGLGKGFIGKRSCEQFLFPGLRETFQKITGIPITRWEEHGMNGRFQSTIAGEPNVYHSDEQTWAGAIYLTPDAPYNAGTSLIAHKPTGIRHSSHPEAYKMWSDPNTYDIHLDPSPWERIDIAANVFNRLVIWNAHCPHAAGEYFGETLDTSRLIHLFFFD